MGVPIESFLYKRSILRRSNIDAQAPRAMVCARGRGYSGTASPSAAGWVVAIATMCGFGAAAT
jgi:hypothetical protein